MHSPTPNAPPSLPPSRRERFVPVALAAVSTTAAFVSHAMFGAPGDHPWFLLVVGCALAFAVGSLRMVPPIAAGLASLAGFPVEALVDLTLHGGHSLLPFEFAIYMGYGFVGMLAARLGRSVARRAATGKYIS